MKNAIPHWSWSACLILAALSVPVEMVRADAALDTAVESAWSFGKTRLDAEVATIKSAHPSNYQTFFPIQTNTPALGGTLGQWRTRSVNDWASGFFPGSLWLMYEKTGDSTVLANAKAWTNQVATLQNTTYDDDMGFRVTTSVYNGYRLSNAANDPGGTYRAACKTAVLNAAASTDVLFNRGGIPVGAMPNFPLAEDWLEPYPVYTDAILNIQLFFDAWDLSGRPSTGAAKTWYNHAVSEANTILTQNMRTFSVGSPRAADDGSTYHIVQYNDGQNGLPSDGSVYAKITNQGYGNETTWSRGQSWAILGLTETYGWTKDDPSANPQDFLSGAKRAADYFIAHLPNNTSDPYNHVAGDFVPPTDFDAALGEPAGPYSTSKPALHTFTGRDSSAAAIAADGMLLLSTLVDNQADRDKYFSEAEDILNCLLTFKGSDNTLDYLGTLTSVDQGILVGQSGAWVSTNATNSLELGDYYFLEAMQRYQAIEATPEPASLALLSVGGLLLVRRPGRRDGRRCG